MNAIDEMERLLECEITESDAKYEESEKKSIKQLHGEEDKYTCVDCDKKFVQKASLKSSTACTQW